MRLLSGSFSVKMRDSKRSGTTSFQFSSTEVISMTDAVFSNFGDARLNIPATDKVRLAKHFREVTPGNWGFLAPQISVNADFENKYSEVAVSLHYSTQVPVALDFNKLNAATRVARQWTPVGSGKERYRYVSPCSFGTNTANVMNTGSVFHEHHAVTLWDVVNHCLKPFNISASDLMIHVLPNKDLIPWTPIP